MQDLNFNEFDKVTEKAWKQKIQADLKGKEKGICTTTRLGL